MKGKFNEYGGQYVPEGLKKALDKLEEEYEKVKDNQDFRDELNKYLKDYVGRPSAMYYAKNLSRELGGAKIYLKREDLNHTGAHKINNALGQILLAKRMGKKRIIAETGAGQHGVATATVAAMFGMECEIYMGAEDIARQEANVKKMRLLGAKVNSVAAGTKTLSDAVDAAIKDWVENVDNTFYLLGSAVGPHPYPSIVKDFQSIIGKEAKIQMLEKEGKLPDYVIAAVGGGSNAIGIFSEFLPDKEVKLIGVEAGGLGLHTKFHAARIPGGKIGVIHGMKSYVISDDEGNILPAYSISAGLDYPAIGPEHAYLNDLKRAEYRYITDDEAVNAFYTLTRTEGIVPALESSHGLAHAMKIAKELPKDKIILVNLSGRGDKDLDLIQRYQQSVGN